MPEPAAPAVLLEQTSVWRHVAGERRYLLRELDWRVERGERWGIVGPNGAGKTTLLRVVSAQMRPSLGRATILGERLGRTSLPELRRRIGFVEASFGRRFYPDQSVFEVVLSGVAGSIVLAEALEAAARERAGELLRTVGAAGLAGRTFASCSEGERARVLLARALITEAPLLILDEPAAGLDLAGRELLLSRAGRRGARPAGADDPHRQPPPRGAAADDDAPAAPARRGRRRGGADRDGGDGREPGRLLRPSPSRPARRRPGLRLGGVTLRIALFITCLSDTLFPDAGRAR